MRKSVQDQLLDYLRLNTGLHSSGNLQRMEWRNRSGTLATPRTVVRRLQELAEEGKIYCDMQGNHAHYRADPPLKSKPHFIIRNGVAVQV